MRLKDKGKKALTETGLKTLEQGLKDPKAHVREHTANAIGDRRNIRFARDQRR